MEIGVHLATSKAKQYIAAFDFWATILDFSWHPDNTEFCAVEVLDQPERFFDRFDVAYAVPEDGAIMVNEHAGETPSESYATAVHEIGHLFGLEHNRDRRSVMFYRDAGEDAVLDRRDLRVLARIHKLRRHAKETAIRRVGAVDDSGYLAAERRPAQPSSATGGGQ